MLLPAIPLDAAMTASDALRRLARYGVWRDPHHPAATEWIEEQRRQLEQAGIQTSFDEVEQRLRRNPERLGAAIRRQWYNQVLWYPRPADFVLRQCLNAAPGDTVLQALNLHESGSLPAIPPPAAGQTPNQEGVVLAGGSPVAISLMLAQAPPRRTRSAPGGGGGRGGGVFRGRGTDTGRPVAPPEIRAWPLLEAPAETTAGTPFTVVVGLAAEQQAGLVTNEQVTLAAPPGATTVELTIELIADGVEAPEGWTRPLVVPVADPTSARASFALVGRAPTGTEPVHLTMIEVRYVLGGTVCGTASRPIEIWRDASAKPPALEVIGTPWTAHPVATSAMTSQPDDQVADLTIEIAKPDGNSSSGHYVCRLYSPHPLTVNRGPHAIDFGEDSKTFARKIVDQIRTYSNNRAVNNLLESWGSTIADRLPLDAHDAIYEVAEVTKPNPPAVLIVSAEPYVPWELTVMDPPLDPALPPYLGVQTLLGRWLRDSPIDSADSAQPAATAPATPRRTRVRKPPVQPPGAIPVRHMAVMAGVYKSDSGLAALPEAEKEAKELVQQYNAVPLAASTDALLQLLEARLEHNFQHIGAPGAVHFAGHGDFNPANPDASVMLLSDGNPLTSDFFRSAKYGGDRQPLIFLNACMIGIGGELLGSMGGFPGNCLKGGFGGVLGALWEVNDAVAHEIAVEFWRRALPPPGRTAEPIATILRDLRAQYSAAAPVTTYLAYVYYGHPRLTLQRTT